MAAGLKDVMISARVPRALVDRVDYVTRNTEGSAKNRSKAVQAALEDWLPGHETDIRKKLGASAKKAE